MAGLDMYAERGQWERCIEIAAKQVRKRIHRKTRELCIDGKTRGLSMVVKTLGQCMDGETRAQCPIVGVSGKNSTSSLVLVGRIVTHCWCQ